jgi:hypothetical protein
MFVGLGIQHAIRVRHVIICGLFVSTEFSRLSHKRHDFRKKVIEHERCVLIFSTTFVWNIFRSKKNWARCDHKCILVTMFSTRYSCQILIKLKKFMGRSSKNTQIPNLIKICPVGVKLFHAEGKTSRNDETNCRCPQFLWTRLKNALNCPEIRLKNNYIWRDWMSYI